MKGKCKGRIEPIDRQDAYITKTPKAVAEICTDHCPYPTPKCGSLGCDYYLSERKRLMREHIVKARKNANLNA